MALIETWLNCDTTKLVTVKALDGNVFSADNEGNLLGVYVSKKGQPVELSGSVIGYVIRPDGETVAVPGSLSGNRAWIVLPQSAYAVVGQISIAIRLVDGSEKTVLAACTGYVNRTTTDTIIDPGHVIPSLEELLAQIEACETATTAATTAAGAANTAASNADTKAALANTAAGNADAKATLANTAAGRADNAAAALENMTATATGLAAGTSPTVSVTEENGHYLVEFGIPKGDTGEVSQVEFDDLKSAIDIIDLTAYADHDTKTSDGITYEYKGDNAWNVHGTLDGTSYYLLFSSETSVAPFVAGGKYLVRFYTPSPNVYVQCYKYVGATWTLFKEIYSSDGNVELVVPADATGIRIRFRTNASVDTTCTLRIYEDTPVIRDIDTLKTGVSTNASDISKLLMGTKYAPINVLALDGTYSNALNVNGVDYTFSNMVCTVNGTSTGISAVNIYNSTSKLPIFIEAGKTYNVKYAPSSNKLTVEFKYYTSGAVNSTLIKVVTEDTTVTIPANAVGMQIRYRVQNGNTVTNDTGCVAMLTDYTVSELSAAVDALREDSEKNLQYAEDMAFTAPISYEVIGNSSKWSIGTAISPANGRLISDAKNCCTGYVAFDDPTLLYFNSDDYDFIVWEYSDASISNATFTPKSEYSGNYAVVTPAQSSTYFRISVRRKDNADMSSSDVTALIATAKCFTLTDKSMTLANAAADAKVSGGLFSSIKNQIMENNSYDVIRNLNGTSGESHGITFTYNNNHTCTVFGTATEATFSNLYANNAALPENVIAGKTYFVKYKSNRVRLRLIKYVNGGEPVQFFETLKDAYVTIPANATGLIIRLHVANQAVIDETIEMPRFMTTPTNDDLFNVALNTNSVDVSKIMFGKNSETNGVAFVYNGNGTVSVTGTATAPAFNNLYYNANALPTGIEAGKTYRIKYSSKKVFLRIYAYINGSDTKICDTLQDTKITIPEGTEGLIIRLQVLTGITVGETFAFPVILTAFSNRELTDIVQGYASEPMLTIIDDDGDVHFKYDLLPLIAELNVPIASAVTPTRIAASEAADPGAYDTRWMTWAQIQECAEGGAEITCHMYSHPTPEQIEAMSLDEIAHRLFMAKNYMKVHGVDSNVLVYSFGTGATGEKLHKAAERVFDCGFSNTSNATPIRSDYDRYDLPRYVIDGDNNYNVENMKDIIDDVAANGGWAVWMIHTSAGAEWRNILDGEGHDTGVADTDGTGNYVGKVKSVPALREAIEYALNLGVKIVTAEYGLKKYFAETGRMN